MDEVFHAIHVEHHRRNDGNPPSRWPVTRIPMSRVGFAQGAYVKLRLILSGRKEDTWSKSARWLDLEPNLRIATGDAAPPAAFLKRNENVPKAAVFSTVVACCFWLVMRHVRTALPFPVERNLTS
jgi:hypothetical protein